MVLDFWRSARIGGLVGKTLSIGLLFSWQCLAQENPGTDLSKPAEPAIKVSDDFVKSGIKTIVLPPNPGSDNQVKRTIFKNIRDGITAIGYQPIPYKAGWRDEDAKMSLDITYTKGQTVSQFAQKMGFLGGSSAQNYSLTVSMKIAVKDGGRSRTIFDASCAMWHKFEPKPQEYHYMGGGTNKVTWPIDHSGSGPANLEEAASQVSSLLVSGLPKCGSPLTSGAQPNVPNAANPPQSIPANMVAEARKLLSAENRSWAGGLLIYDDFTLQKTTANWGLNPISPCCPDITGGALVFSRKSNAGESHTMSLRRFSDFIFAFALSVMPAKQAPRPNSGFGASSSPFTAYFRRGDGFLGYGIRFTDKETSFVRWDRVDQNEEKMAKLGEAFRAIPWTGKRIVVEIRCRQDTIDCWLDGRRVATQRDSEYSVGFIEMHVFWFKGETFRVEKAAVFDVLK